jgi:hypothetical protein
LPGCPPDVVWEVLVVVRSWVRRAGFAAGVLVAVVGAAGAAVPQGGGLPGFGVPDGGSRITAVTVTGRTPVGTFGGAGYQRLVGTVDGVVAAGERVVGLAGLPTDRAGRYHYSAQFELITAGPGQPRSDGVVVEAENRGNPFLLASLQNFGGLLRGSPATVVYPAGLGNGFLQDNGLSWARVQWQGPSGGTDPAIDPTVPVGAQGVGEVVMRDFALLLRGADGAVGRAAGLPDFGRLILGADSQSAWFANTFLAEGFNVPPARRGGPRQVFEGMFTLDGTGNWLAVNQLNQARGATTQSPYVQPDGVPLTPRQLLHRPLTDPFVVDVTAYTDFYRVRASVFDTAPRPPGLRVYDLPAAHAPGVAVPAGITVNQLGCALGGTPIPALNPLDPRPMQRAFLMGLARRIGVRGLRGPAPLLPPSNDFRLTDAPAQPDLDPANPALPLFNGLPGVRLRVPAVDADNQPLGGVDFPDVRLTLGVPSPVSVPPVATRSIADTCGNFGGWRPFGAAELAHRYGSADAYVAAYAPLLDRLIARGFVLAADRDGVLAYVRSLYARAT